LTNKIVFWGVCLVIFLVPLPFGAVDEWAVFGFEAATFVLFVLHIVGVGRADESECRAGAAGRYLFPPWLRLLSALTLGVPVLQLVPLPFSVVGAVSPRAAVVWKSLFPGASGAGAAAGGWVTISLIPNLTLYELVRYIFYFLFGYLVFKHVNTRKRVQTFVLVLFAGACFQAFYGLAEFFGGTQRILGFQREAYLDSVTGTFINRNHFAGFLEMIFPLSVGYLLARASFFSMRRGGTFREKVLWFSQERLQKAIIFGIVPVILGMGIFFSRSRTGIFGFFASLFLMFAALSVTGGRRPGSAERAHGGARRQGRVIRTVIVAVVFAVILVGIKPVIERFSFSALAGEVRPVYFRNTVEIIKDFPFAGTGLGTYLYAYPAYETTFRGELLEHAHNDYLEILAEGGIVGGGLLVFVAIGALGILTVRWARRRDYFVRGVGVGCLAGIAAILIHSLTDFNLHITANAVLFVTLYALAGRVVGLNAMMRNRRKNQ
jgi:O-antigen ligase